MDIPQNSVYWQDGVIDTKQQAIGWLLVVSKWKYQHPFEICHKWQSIFFHGLKRPWIFRWISRHRFVIQVDFYCSWPISLCFGMLVLCDGLVAEWFCLWNVFLPVLFSLVGSLLPLSGCSVSSIKSFLVHPKKKSSCAAGDVLKNDLAY